MRRAVLVAVLVTLVAACGGGTTVSTSTAPGSSGTTIAPVEATTPTTAVIETTVDAGPLVVWVSDEGVADAVIARADVYSAQTGVEVFVITWFSAPEDDRLFLDELIADEFALPVLPDGVEAPEIPAEFQRLPDLVIGPHSWLVELAEVGLAGPVTLPDGMPAGAVAAVTLRGFTVGVPVALDATVQYRNPSEMATRPGDVSDLTCAEGQTCLLFPGDGDPDIHLPFVLSLGGFVFGDDPDLGFAHDEIGVGSTEAIAGGAILQGLFEESVLAVAADRESARVAFEEGAVGIIWDGAAALGRFPDAIVELLPTIGQNTAVSPVRVTAVWVNAASAFETEAAEFAVEHLASIQGSTDIARALGMAPVWTDGASDAERVIIEAAASGLPVPYIPEAEIAWEALARAFARIYEGISAGEALIDAADEIRFP